MDGDNQSVIPASGSWRKLALVTGKRYKKNLISFERLLDRTIDNISTATQSNISNQILISDTSTKRDVCRVVQVKKSEKTSIESKPLVTVVKEFIQESTFKSLSWFNDSMIAGSIDGQIFYYQNNPNSTDDPELRETFIHTKLKGIKEVSQTIGSTGFNTVVKSVSINKLNPETFSSLENNYYHIWDFSDAVRPTISYKVSDQPIYCSKWSPHSKNYSLIGGSENSIRITDTRLMSSYGTTRKSPTVWSNHLSANSTNTSSLLSTVSVKNVAWHPFVPYWFASASDNGEISMWDLRSTAEPIISFFGHSSSISNIDWCPTHSELLVSSGIDGEYKMWSLMNEPHYNLFQKDEVSPFIYSGFFENDGYNNFGVNQAGEIYYADINPKFMNPIIHSKFEKKEKSERVAEHLIYNRDFTQGFEKAIQLANKHSRTGTTESLEKAKTLLSLCFQQNIDDSLSDVLKSTILKVNCKKETLKEIEAYAYYIPPTYYEKYSTQLSTNLMTKIKELKVNLDIQYHIKSFKGGEEITDIERDVLMILKGDHNSIRMETILELVEVLLNYNTTKCFQFAIQVVEIFKTKLNYCMPIVRLLLHPSIFEKKYQLGDSTNSLGSPLLNTSGTIEKPSSLSSSSPSISSNTPPPASPFKKDHIRSGSVSSGANNSNSNSNTPSPSLGRSTPSGGGLRDSSGSVPPPIVYGNGDLEEMKLNEYLTNADQIIQQLSFMKDFLRLLNSPTPIKDASMGPDVDDIIDFSSKNRLNIVLSMPINRIYLEILQSFHIFDQFYIILFNLLNAVTEEFEFNQYLNERYEILTPEFLYYIKESQTRDKLKVYDTERYSTPLLTIVSILYNVQPQAIPLELYETLLQSLPVFIEEIDNSLISTIQQPDPSSHLPGKAQSTQKAQSIADSIKNITTEKLPPSTPGLNRRSVALSKPISPQSSSSKISPELATQLQNLNTVLNKYIY
ncbi:hypothetical protein DICPUDRAFT_151427 [Dictyostelium purpureum]|uniref:Uncharacterized protein n=1 Tax=Dictyostelium purpureum TaxID=5786 RepID=F0ZIT4_DICPU|nr:uncharacterized protein DICPUDRAFT_151427 [Dictyostelium purpureum]EGC36144.1 hypothetical protein DICPUDRAFT_151427 [Dictyostelium purpureum]|eukprot:XP_003287337.1 hypothetical protein DICPUDRAFT_151427 [Dictyostelium purpureum]